MRATRSAADLLREGLRAVETECALPDAFPPDVEDTAQRVASSSDWRAGRADARSVPFRTLDPATSTDLDQAFAIAREKGDLVLSYAIADLSAFVPRGSLIEQEAWRRGTTVYLPHLRVPQYPKVLSEGAASLLPGVDRPAVVLTVVIDPAGEVALRSAERSIIRSVEKRAYETTDVADLDLLDELAARTSAADARRGEFTVDSPEQEIVDDANSPSGIALRFRPRLASESANAAMSLAANLAVAKRFVSDGIGLFRDLDAPNDHQYAALRRLAAGLGIAWARRESLGDVTRRLRSDDPRHAAFASACRRAGGGATYRVHDGTGPAPWHAAMAAAYSHATAPLRRLADRYTLDLLVGLCADARPTDAERATLAALPEIMDRAEAKAAKAERACLDLAESVLLAGRVGEVFDAVVIESAHDGTRISIADPAIAAKVKLDAAQPGERVQVRLASADPSQRRIVFAPSP